LVEGTVPRGYLRADKEFYTGKKNKAGSVQGASGAQTSATAQLGATGPNPTAPTGANAQSAVYPDDVEVFPIPITMETVNRGQQRYQIYCSACHGMTGNGDGLVVRRGFRKPPSFHEERLRQAPVGHFFDVSTNGWGAMPSYAAQITPADRWAIISYIRALQLSQQPAAEPGTSPTPAPAGTAGGKEHTK
jgi:mono/diheme cytochrome c family protein